MIVKHPVKLGLVCLARTTYDYKAAEKLYANIRTQVSRIENVHWEWVEKLVISQEDGIAAAEYLSTKALDGLVCISGTFHLGHLVLQLKRQIDLPILLWGCRSCLMTAGRSASTACAG